MSDLVSPERRAIAASRAHLHDHDPKDTPELRAVLHMQISHAQYRKPPPCGVCTVEVTDWTGLYRCGICGLWLCAWCSTRHTPRPASPTPEHIAAALALMAAQYPQGNPEQWEPVPSLEAVVWYDWSDPSTGKVGQCQAKSVCGPVIGWHQPPRGVSPVILRFTIKPRS